MMMSLLMMLSCGPKQSAVSPDGLVGVPKVGQLPDYSPPVVQEGYLNNGARVLVIEDHQLPLISLRLLLPGSSCDDPIDKWGLASLSMSMLSESAGGLSTAEISRKFRFI